MQPIPILEVVWGDISLDFISGLPRSQGFDVILVIVDRLSKYAHFLSLKHPYTAHTVAEVFICEVAKLHGFPKSIISNRNPLFLSKFCSELFCLQGTTLRMSTISITLKQMVKQRLLIDVWRPICIVSLLKNQRNGIFGSLGRSIGTILPSTQPRDRLPRLFMDERQFLLGETQVDSVASVLVDRDEAIHQLKFHLHRAQQSMKKAADKHCHAVSFAEGDWVFVKLCPHRQHTVACRINPKLSTCYFGPSKILSRVGEVAYKLKLPESARVHPVFHLSQLKKPMTVGSNASALPRGLTLDESASLFPEYANYA